MAERSDALKKAQQKYMERFAVARIRMERGKYEAVQKYAEKCGKSVNALVVDLLNQAMSCTTAGTAGSPTRPADAGEVPVDQEERDSSATPSAANELKIKMSPGNQENIRGYAEAHGESVDEFVFRAIVETMKRGIAEMKAKTSQTVSAEADPAAE